MAGFAAADVKKLRDATGAGMMDCKKALTEADGDFDKAVELLRVTGQAKAAKRGAERSASNGLVVFADGALVQLGAETDFVAKNAEFQALADDAVKAVAAAKADAVEAANAATLPSGKTVGEAVERPRRSRSARSSRSPTPRTSTARPRSTCTSARPTCRRRSVCWWSTRATTPTAARTAAMQIAAMKPQYLSRGRGPGRPGRERAPDRRGHGQGGGQARAGRARGSSRVG